MDTETNEPKPPLRERMRAAAQRTEITVPCPLVGEVRLRNLSAREQIAVADKIPEGATNLETTAHYIIACVLDETGGDLLYSEADYEEVLALDPRILATLIREIREFLGLDISVRDKAKN